MSLRFVGPRSPTAIDELGEPEREQLRIAWRSYSGEDASPAQLVADNPGWFQLWSVERGGRRELDFWHFPPDSGQLFCAGEAVPSGVSMVQFSFIVSFAPLGSLAIDSAPRRRLACREPSTWHAGSTTTRPRRRISARSSRSCRPRGGSAARGPAVGLGDPRATEGNHLPRTGSRRPDRDPPRPRDPRKMPENVRIARLAPTLLKGSP